MSERNLTWGLARWIGTVIHVLRRGVSGVLPAGGTPGGCGAGVEERRGVVG